MTLAPIEARGLVVPRLIDIPMKAGAVGGEEIRATFALAMLNAGIARPNLWQPESTPATFIGAAFADWLNRHGASEIDRRFSFDVALSNSLSQWNDEREPAVFLSLATTGFGFAEWGHALRWLERSHPRLPATVWLAFHEVHSLFGGYDHHNAEEYEQMLRENMDDEDFARYEDGQKRPLVADHIPESISREPLSATAVGRLKASWSPAVRATAEAAVRLRVAAKPACTCAPDWDEINDLVPSLSDQSQPIPCFVSLFEEHDAVAAAFDDERQSLWMNGDEAPNLLIPFHSSTTEEVRRGFDRFASHLAVLREAANLLNAIPSFSKWTFSTSRGKTLAEVFTDLDSLNDYATPAQTHRAGSLWEEAA